VRVRIDPGATLGELVKAVHSATTRALEHQELPFARIVASAPEVLPALSNVVGVTTGEAAKTRGDFIRGVLKARRKAVEFMYANPAEASKIIAKVYNLDAGVTEKVVRALLESEKKGGVPYWGPGDLRIDTMNNMIRAQKLVGAVKGDVDWSKLIDESFLPDDLKSKKK